MSEGYYEPHARIALGRPLVLLGHPGSGVSAVARVLCGRTGLPLNHVARLVEARAGRSRGQIAVEDGAEGLRGLESEVLREAIARMPAGVVATDSACLLFEADRAWVRSRALLVYLQRPADFLFRRIRSEVAADPGSQPDFVFAIPESVEELAEHLAPHEVALSAAHVILDAGERHPIALADEVLVELDAMTGARAGE